MFLDKTVTDHLCISTGIGHNWNLNVFNIKGACKNHIAITSIW